MESAAGMEADDVMVKVAHHDCESIKPSARVRTIAITKISRNNLLISRLGRLSIVTQAMRYK